MQQTMTATTRPTTSTTTTMPPAVERWALTDAGSCYADGRRDALDGRPADPASFGAWALDYYRGYLAGVAVWARGSH